MTGQEPNWMARLYFTVEGVNGEGGLVADMEAIKKWKRKTDLRLLRIALWGGLILITWTLVTSASVNIELLFKVLDLAAGLLKLVKGLVS